MLLPAVKWLFLLWLAFLCNTIESMPWPGPRTDTSTANGDIPEEDEYSCNSQDDSNFFAIRSILDNKVRNNMTLLHQLAGIFSDENHPLKQVVVMYKIFIPKDDDDECPLNYTLCNRGQAYDLDDSANDTSCPTGYYCITTDRFIWARYPATAHDLIFRDLDACSLVIGDYRQENITIYFNISTPPSCSSSLLDNSSIVREEFPCGWNCNFKKSDLPRIQNWHPSDIFGDDGLKTESHIDKALLRITAKLLQYAMSKDNLPGFSYSPDDYLGYASEYVYSRYFHPHVAHAEYTIFLLAYALLNIIITSLIVSNHGKHIIEKVNELCKLSGCNCKSCCTRSEEVDKTAGSSCHKSNENANKHQSKEASGSKNTKNDDANTGYNLALFLSFIFTSLILFSIIILTALAEGGVCITVMQFWVIALSLFFGVMSYAAALLLCNCSNLCDKASSKQCCCTCISCTTRILICGFIFFFPHVILMLFFFTVVSFIYNPSGTGILIMYFCSSSVILWIANAVVIHLIISSIKVYSGTNKKPDQLDEETERIQVRDQELKFELLVQIHRAGGKVQAQGDQELKGPDQRSNAGRIAADLTQDHMESDKVTNGAGDKTQLQGDKASPDDQASNGGCQTQAAHRDRRELEVSAEVTDGVKQKIDTLEEDQKTERQKLLPAASDEKTHHQSTGGDSNSTSHRGSEELEQISSHRTIHEYDQVIVQQTQDTNKESLRVQESLEIQTTFKENTQETTMKVKVAKNLKQKEVTSKKDQTDLGISDSGSTSHGGLEEQPDPMSTRTQGKEPPPDSPVKADESKSRNCNCCCECCKQMWFAFLLFLSSNLMNLSIMPFIADYYYDKRVDISLIFSALVPAVITVIGWYFGSTLIAWMKAQDDGLLKDIGGILEHLLELFKKLHKPTKSSKFTITGEIEGDQRVVKDDKGQFILKIQSERCFSATSSFSATPSSPTPSQLKTKPVQQ